METFAFLKQKERPEDVIFPDHDWSRASYNDGLHGHFQLTDPFFMLPRLVTTSSLCRHFRDSQGSGPQFTCHHFYRPGDVYIMA